MSMQEVPAPEQIDAEGCAIVWDLTSSKWTRMRGCDVREALENGSVSLMDPEGRRAIPEHNTPGARTPNKGDEWPFRLEEVKP